MQDQSAAPLPQDPLNASNSSASEQLQPNTPQETTQEVPDAQPAPRVEQEYELLTWTAPSRPYKKHDREYYTTIAVIVFLLSIILFFAGQFLPIAVVVAVAFLSYVRAAVPPDTVTHTITTYGIRTLGKLYPWEILGRFWYTQRYKQMVLNIETAGFPNKLLLLLGDQKQKELDALLSQYLVNQEPTPTFIEKAAAWLQKRVPLEKE